MLAIRKNPRTSKPKSKSKPKPPSEQDAAKRQHHHKSRFGCLSCKKRRVKCDETKPACKRCTDAGVECSGYLLAGLSNAQPPVPKKDKVLLIPRVVDKLTLTSPPSQLVGASEENRRTFEFFRSETAPMLSGYFDADFWNHFLLQLSHINPTIWHSVLALSAFHEQRLLRDDGNGQQLDLARRRYALQHYNQAVGHLTGNPSTGKESTEVVLVSCLLFISIEALLGNMTGVVNHVFGGIQILRSWKKDRARSSSSRLSPKFIENNLIPIFEHMNQYSFTHGLAAPPINEPDFSFAEPASEYFANILAAKASLLSLISGAQRFTIDFGSSSSDQPDVTRKHAEVFQKHRLLYRVQRWKAALDEFLARPNQAYLSDRDRRAIALLRVQHNFVWILICNANNTEETSFDAYITNFEEIVNLAESTFTTEPATSWSERWAAVTFQLQHLSSLFMTALRCRNPSIRRKALMLLKNTHINGEGRWEMQRTIKMGERIIELEEEGLEDLTDAKGDVVPSEWARIHTVIITPETADGQRRDLVTVKRKLGGDGTHWREKSGYCGGLIYSELGERLRRPLTSNCQEL